jgi:L-cysteine S-thiosulfotransferase
VGGIAEQRRSGVPPPLAPPHKGEGDPVARAAREAVSSAVGQRLGDLAAYAVLAFVLSLATIAAAHAQDGLRQFAVVGDTIPHSLTGAKGDPVRGRAIVTNRQVGLCLLCHSGPFPEERLRGTLAPDLKGVGARWTEGQLRLRIVDAAQLNPTTIMPPYYRVDGLSRVAPSFRGKPVLSAEQIEDVVAFLATLRE